MLARGPDGKKRGPKLAGKFFWGTAVRGGYFEGSRGEGRGYFDLTWACGRASHSTPGTQANQHNTFFLLLIPTTYTHPSYVPLGTLTQR